MKALAAGPDGEAPPRSGAEASGFKTSNTETSTHEAPPSVVNWIKPLLVPAHITPDLRREGDNVVIAAVLRPAGPAVGAAGLEAGLLDTVKSGLTGCQFTPRSVVLSTYWVPR